MTLIAFTVSKQVPCIIGDLLLSSPADRSISLPTNALDIEPYLKITDCRAVGLSQKIYVIKDNVCVALAGKVVPMTAFLKELKTRCSYYETVSKQNIEDFLEECKDEPVYGGTSFFIIVMDFNEDGRYRANVFRSGDWKEASSELFQMAFVCGSGKTVFLNQLTAASETMINASNGAFQYGILCNLSLLARLLAVERVSLFSIEKLWGGGFETALFDGKRFSKVDNFAFVISHGHFDEVGEIGFPHPKLVLYYKYQGSILFISAIEVNTAQVTEKEETVDFYSTDFLFRLFVVVPLDYNMITGPEITTDDLSFHTHRLAMGYALMTLGSIWSPSFTSERGDVNVAFGYNSSICISLRKDVNDKIRSSAKTVFPKLDKS